MSGKLSSFPHFAGQSKSYVFSEDFSAALCGLPQAEPRRLPDGKITWTS
jgi:hypothetical protein